LLPIFPANNICPIAENSIITKNKIKKTSMNLDVNRILTLISYWWSGFSSSRPELVMILFLNKKKNIGFNKLGILNNTKYGER
jgi:hypothetical protein